jgi:electron transfer flavoprotein alpha subunit
MAGKIWVLAEQWRGELSEITYELLALGRELAEGLGTSLEAVLLGHEAKDLAGHLGAADAVLYADHPKLAEPTAEVSSHVLARLVEERKPGSLLVSLTNVAADLVGLLPAQLEAPFINNCRDVRVVEGQLRAHAVIYGGKMEVAVAADRAPTILGILPGARRADAARVKKTPSTEEVTVSLPEATRVKFKKYIEPEPGDVDLTQQDILVSVGRGIQSQDNVALAEELAKVLGGAVCGSRPVIDQGWLPLSRQVGKSGVSVKPKLYLAAGVSGAPEHVEGMKSSDLIVAINTDPEAPIYHVAHYGIVEDVVDVLPALAQALRAKRAKTHAG